MTGPDCRDCVHFFEDEDRKVCLNKIKNFYGGVGCPEFSTTYKKKTPAGDPFLGDMAKRLKDINETKEGTP